jgi:PmbA protein
LGALVADLAELCRAALAGADGDEQAEAYAGESKRTEVRARRGEIDSLTSAASRGVGVRVLIGSRLGYAWAADPDPEEAKELLASARRAAEHATPDEANVLPEARPIEEIPALFRSSLVDLDPERKVSLALELERAALAAKPEVRRVEEVMYGDAVSRVALGSTEGLAAEYRRTDCWCVVSAMADRDGETQSGFAFRVAREPDDLKWEDAAREAATRAARLLGSKKPGTERLPVILDPWAAASFLGVLASSLSAEEVQKGRSLLADLVGEQVASELVTMVDDGRLDDGPSTAPFDDEGVPTFRTPLIERGVLRGFLHNTETARRDDAESTGNASRPSYRGVPGVAPSNLVVEGGSETADAILGRAGRAVYIQDVTGVHSGANPVSGEFSVGATGLRVEGGALGEPLREITIASTLPEVLRRVEAVGSDVRFFPGAGAIGTPTILVGEMTVAGT